MNRLILVCLMILTLCLSVSLAEEETQPLYPFRKTLSGVI